MERDVELQLTQRMAAIEATISGFAKDVTRRFDEQAVSLAEIEDQVKRTNGRVNVLEQDRAVREAMAKVPASSQSVPVVASSVITLSDLKWWIAIAMGSGGFAVSVTLWILKMVGKL